MSSPSSTGGSLSFLSLDRVAAAVEALSACALGRTNAQFIRWLYLKRNGFPGVDPVSVTSTGCKEFAKDFFEVYEGSTYPYFVPFSKQWMAGKGTDWPVQTIYTQFQRINQKEQTLYESPTLAPRTKGSDASTEIRCGPDYKENLSSLLPEACKVPILEMAVWRYRKESWKKTPTDSDLIEKLETELNLTTDDEKRAVFE